VSEKQNHPEKNSPSPHKRQVAYILVFSSNLKVLKEWSNSEDEDHTPKNTSQSAKKNSQNDWAFPIDFLRFETTILLLIDATSNFGYSTLVSREFYSLLINFKNMGSRPFLANFFDVNRFFLPIFSQF